MGNEEVVGIGRFPAEWWKQDTRAEAAVLVYVQGREVRVSVTFRSLFWNWCVRLEEETL